jgi:hypothetical protein
MPNCYYTCDLLPLDLIVEAGYSPRWLGGHLRDPSAPARREALSVHPMTCPYVTKLVAAAEGVLAATGNGGAAAFGSVGNAPGNAPAASAGDRLVVPGGCDAMRRMGDLLAAKYPGRVFMLSMPRSSGARVAETLASDLCRLDEWLRSGAAQAETKAPGAPASVAAPPSLDYPAPPRPGGVFLVAGPLSDDSLLRLIGTLGLHVSGLESCTSPDRWKPLAAAAAAGARGGTRGGARDYLALANLVLSAGMCPRRSTADRLAHLARRLDEARPTSIIYARQSFCDPGAYAALLVAQLAQERQLPYLEIEVDFPFDAGGPLRTRVEAFLEAQLLDDDLLAGDGDLPGKAPAGAPSADTASADLPDDDLFED